MTREETKWALAKVQELCEKHNAEPYASYWRVTAYPYEREFDGKHFEIGLVIRETGINFNSFDIINGALGLDLFCCVKAYSEAYFGSSVLQAPGTPHIFEGDIIAEVCMLIKKEV